MVSNRPKTGSITYGKGASLESGVPLSQSVGGVTWQKDEADSAPSFFADLEAVADVDRDSSEQLDEARTSSFCPVSTHGLPAGNVEKGQGFRFYTFEEFDALPPMDWTYKELLPRRGLGQLFGESGAGKSFVALDLAWHIAEGRDWFGWKCKRHEKGNPHIFYLALEGAEGFRNRVRGVKARWFDPMGRPFPTNLHFFFDDFKLAEEGHIASLIEYVNAVKGEVPPLVVIDTQAQASGIISINDPEAMKGVVTKAGHIQKAVDGFVLLVAHAGKNTDPSKGAMGSVEQKNPCDTQIAVLRNGDTRTVKAVKVKDGQDGVSQDFTLLSMPLGEDEDGDPITTCTVERVEKSKGDASTLSKSERFALQCFDEARGDSRRTLTDEEWREVFYMRHTSDNQNSKRTAFGRAKLALQEKGILLCVNNTYTLASDSLLSEGGTSAPC